MMMIVIISPKYDLAHDLICYNSLGKIGSMGIIISILLMRKLKLKKVK